MQAHDGITTDANHTSPWEFVRFEKINKYISRFKAHVYKCTFIPLFAFIGHISTITVPPPYICVHKSYTIFSYNDNIITRCRNVCKKENFSWLSTRGKIK